MGLNSSTEQIHIVCGWNTSSCDVQASFTIVPCPSYIAHLFPSILYISAVFLPLHSFPSPYWNLT